VRPFPFSLDNDSKESIKENMLMVCVAGGGFYLYCLIRRGRRDEEEPEAEGARERSKVLVTERFENQLCFCMSRIPVLTVHNVHHNNTTSPSPDRAASPLGRPPPPQHASMSSLSISALSGGHSETRKKQSKRDEVRFFFAGADSQHSVLRQRSPATFLPFTDGSRVSE
jgi:hypothetical protein